MNPLVGRDRVLSSLGSHLDATLQGSSGCVIVDGPFGIGKTHLLRAAAMEGAERGLTVVAGRTSITDQPIPIHLLINFLRHATTGEADFDDLVRPGRNPFWLMDRVGELAGSAARRRPLMVVLDDAQRIDDVSALALRGLVQSLASSPVLWLLARRPVPTESLAQSVVDWLIDNAAAHLHLGALDHEAVVELCTSILGAKPDASVLDWAARCGGNPWLMENVFSALIKAGQMIITDGTASVVAERLPEGVRTVVHSLLDGMSPAVRRLLVAGGGIGPRFTAERVAAALGGSCPDLDCAVDEAVQVGLVRRDGTELAFLQEVVGEALRPAAPAPAPRVRPALTSVVAADPEPPVPVVVPVPVPPAVPRPAAPPAREPGCGCAEVAVRAFTHLAKVFDEGPRTVARALRLLAGAGRGAEARRLADAALRTGLEATAEAQLVLDLAQGLRDAGGQSAVPELLQRTLARHDICELDRAKLNRALADTRAAAGGVPAAVPGRGARGRRARTAAPASAHCGPGWSAPSPPPTSSTRRPRCSPPSGGRRTGSARRRRRPCGTATAPSCWRRRAGSTTPGSRPRPRCGSRSGPRPRTPYRPGWCWPASASTSATSRPPATSCA
ncbi:hypothetical protein Psuf_091330 [Phytohabitans suffuscus]|uniref:Orc1-like AAA ATPase domain-containing protein n=1 Tax=Phytohabitans suffuscus TaxID=624315 RepID=A0A6F8Z064_9ACTN|nr:ATP-binding protein [Phytohabitans suffuscus]BCB91820.1 hypothetical protein Psuf_091330 [Phytohabitans suffuscus]